jgi:hypothetical protein
MRGALDFFVVTPRKPCHRTPTAMVGEWLLAHSE